MSQSIRYVLDSNAALAFGKNVTVGEILAGAAVIEETVAVPVLCLAEGYRVTPAGEGIDLLDVLASQPAVTITPVNSDDGAILGGWASVLGSFHLAHAVLEAATHHAPLITSQRHVVSRILPVEWPIIDL